GEPLGDDARDVLVLEWQDARLAIDQLDVRLAELREDRRVLAADNAGADDREPLWQLGDVLDVVARDDAHAVDRDVRRHARPRADREQELVGLDAAAADRDRVRLDEARAADHALDRATAGPGLAK